MHDLFLLRDDGYHGRCSERTGIFHYADDGISDRVLSAAYCLDFYHLCLGFDAVCTVFIIPGFLGADMGSACDLLFRREEKMGSKTGVCIRTENPIVHEKLSVF